jgi:hypothetical protein
LARKKERGWEPIKRGSLKAIRWEKKENSDALSTPDTLANLSILHRRWRYDRPECSPRVLGW